MTAIAHKGRTAVLVVLLAAHLGYAAFLGSIGHFTVDEGVYHMMARAFAEHGSLAVWNGYAETPSDELVYTFLHVDDRDPTNPRLVPQYPATYAVIAAPFYLAGGLHGLFALNLLAFFAAVWLTMAIARRLFDDRGLALNAALILVIGTFTWEYAHAIWPHILSMAVATGAMLAGVVAIQQQRTRRAVFLAGVAGLIIGIGTGIRYDAVLLAPALALPFLFASPVRLSPVAALIVGLIPGLLFLAITNEAKFGTFSPFSYGVGVAGNAAAVASYAGLIAVALAVLALAWMASRPLVLEALAGHRWWLLGLGIAVVATVFLVPALRALAARLLDGTWQLVVDLRIRSLDVVEWGVSRTPGGAVAYDQALKKSLLQSCPWMILLLLPLIRWLRQPGGGAALAPLFLAIAGFIAFYAYFAWHGGYALNMRYFVTFLPFAAVLGALGWRCLTEDVPSRWRLAAITVGFASLVAWLAMLVRDPGLGIESLLLNPPLILAALLLAALAARAITSGRLRAVAATTGLTITAMGLAWATAAALLYDLPRARNARANSAQIAAAIAPELDADSILFSRYANTVSNLLAADRVRLAFPRNDDFADFRRLLHLHLDAGRSVFFAFNDEYRDIVADRQLLEGLTVELFYESDDTYVGRIVRADGS